MNPEPTAENAFVLLLVVIVLALAYVVMMGPDQRTMTQKLGDAVHELPQGLDKGFDGT